MSKATYYRNRLKKIDPPKYEAYLTSQAKAAKQRRDKLREELQKRKPSSNALADLEKQREKGRARQQRYMERKKKSQNTKPQQMKIKFRIRTPNHADGFNTQQTNTHRYEGGHRSEKSILAR